MAAKKPTKKGPGIPAPLAPWETKYPDYPNLIGDERLSDCDSIFEQARSGVELPGEDLFHAAILARFSQNIYAGKTVEQWILNYLADRFTSVLRGAAWDDMFRLPGRKLPPEWDVFHPLEARDLQIYCDVENLRSAGGKVTPAIVHVASANACSYETARAAYYKWRSRINSKDRDEIQKDEDE